VQSTRIPARHTLVQRRGVHDLLARESESGSEELAAHALNSQGNCLKSEQSLSQLEVAGPACRAFNRSTGKSSVVQGFLCEFDAHGSPRRK
jgi:hypothetical protein